MFDERPRRAPTSEEVSLALRHCWQPVARLQDLKHGPQRAVLLGEALAVFLTESGKPAVVADRCAHRGASLSMGKVEGDSIQCPYHGWEWGENGGCTRIPSLPDQGQIPASARIAAFPAREHWGLVWTVLEEPLGELPTMPWFDENEWRWGHGTPFELPVSFGIMIENFRDVAHFAFVHQATLGTMPEVIEPLQPERDEFRVTLRRKMTAGDGADEIWGSLRELHTHAIAPNFTSGQILTDKGERCLLHAARAISATESAHYWIAGITEDYEEFSVEETIEFEQRLYKEDRAIISAVEPPELSLDPNAEANTLADRFTLSYRQAFSDYVDRALSLRIRE
jgi:phenylpropionate dioxygenase-like ring-hydroxylating dioxygenase large terminal subunit